MINPNTMLSINPLYRLQWETAQNCHVLLFPEGMIQLNGAAAEILTRCQPPCSIASLIENLTQAFPDAPGLREDVNDFIKVASTKGWLILD